MHHPIILLESQQEHDAVNVNSLVVNPKPSSGNVLLLGLLRGLGCTLATNLHTLYLGHESEDSMSTLAGRRGMRPKMMMPFDSQPPQRK